MHNSENARLAYYALALQNALLFSAKCYFDEYIPSTLEEDKLNMENKEATSSTLCSLRGIKDNL